MKPEITLRTRLVMLVLAAIIPLFCLSLVRAVLSIDTAVQRTTKSLEFTASMVAANQQRLLDSAQQMLITIAAMPEMRNGNVQACSDYFKRLKSQLKVYSNIGLIGADGFMLCHTVDNDPPGFAGDRSYFKQAMESKRFVADGFVRGRISGSPIITFALPLLNGGGDATAVVFVAMMVTELSQGLSSVQLPPESQLLIMDRSGVVLATYPESAAVVGLPVPAKVLKDAVEDGREAVLEGLDATGVNRIYAFLPGDHAARPSTFVAISSERGAVLEAARKQLILEFAVLALGAFLGGLLAWKMGGGAIVKPTAGILAATGKLQSGQLGVRIPLDPDARGSEFTRIAEGVNRMADSLEQRDRELALELAHSRQANMALEELQVAQASNYAELRETQRKLLDAQRLGRIGHWELDFGSQKLDWSVELEELFGLRAGSFDGAQATFMQLMHPDDRAEYARRCEEAHRDGTPFEAEYRVITPEGELRWMHQSGKINYGADNQPATLTGVIQEITARKKSALALAHSTEQLRRTGEMARIGGWAVTFDPPHSELSDEFYRLLGLDPASRISAEEALIYYPPEVQPLLRMHLRAAIKNGVPWDMELPLVTAKGGRIWVRTQGQPVMTDGRITGLEGAVQDITSQYDSREQLRLLETSISRLNDMVMITEAEPITAPGPRIIYVNDAFVRRTGYSREEVIGQSPRFLQGPRTQRAELDRIAEALAKWQPVRAELINYTREGEEFWVELDIVPIADARGWFTHWVAVERDITERKAAEKALIESEQRYAALFDMAPVAMWVYEEVNAKFITVNSAAIAVYGYSAQEFRAMSVFDVNIPSEHARLRLQVQGTQQKENWMHVRKDGSEFPVNVVSKPIQYAGKAARFAVVLDMTAQVNAEREVQEYLFTLQRAADAAQAITWHQMLDGVLQEFAGQARGVVGAHQAIVSLTVSRTEEQGITALSLSEKYQKYRDLDATAGGAGVYAMVREGNRTVRMTQAELEAHPRWRGFDDCEGEHLAMRGLLAVPLMGRHGENIGLLQLSDKYEGEFTLQDEYVVIELAQLASTAIENARLLQQVNQLNAGLEQKVEERTLALARQEALFRALAEQAPQVVWTADSAGDATYFNRAWFELIGGDFEDWAGDKWFGVMHPDDLENVLKNWKAATTSQMPFAGIRRLRAIDGSYHTMSYRASPVFDDQGRVVFWVGIDADITELKAIETALRLSNEELEAFSYSVSHDLRSPLNTIDGFSRLLAKHIGDDVGDKSKHYLARIQAGVAQMGKLIEDLLSLAQVSRMQLRYESLDLSLMSQRILDESASRNPQRNVTVSVEPGLQAMGDGRLVRVLLDNLLANAWKFTSQTEDAKITVGKTTDKAGQPAFFIADNGAGFDMAYADKLFIAFQRLHSASEFPGTGIGLATVSRIIGRHEGRIWAESAPGRGATFFFTLA